MYHTYTNLIAPSEGALLKKALRGNSLLAVCRRWYEVKQVSLNNRRRLALRGRSASRPVC